MDMVMNVDGRKSWIPAALPDWVPPGTARYLAHTEWGLPIRHLARAANCHASTILRQIRKVEMRRDDPLVDAGLRSLGAIHRAQPSPMGEAVPCRPAAPADAAEPVTQAVPDKKTLLAETPRILRRLCETGALLAVATEMDKAVVVRDAGSAAPTRTAVVTSAVAQAMAIKGWIAPGNTGRIIRYHITAHGRTALARMVKGQAGKPAAPGLSEAAAQYLPKDETDPSETRHRRMRYCLADSPLIALARRRDRDGSAFLADPLVHAGERLREDFELAQMGTSITQNWEGFLTAGTSKGTGHQRCDTASDARARVAAALNYLGPGLSEVVLHCCCFLEGLETTEKRLGWSARSGKIVLRIALMRLQRFYEKTEGPGGPMIG